MTGLFILWLSAHAGATCVSDLDYPTALTLPTLEVWSKERLFGRATSETECRLVRSLASLYDYIERRAAEDQPATARRRGVGAKGVCFAGTFRRQFDPKLTESKRTLLRRAEMLADAYVRPVTMRFANQSLRPRPDWERDFRGFSLGIELDHGRRQDFTFQNVSRAQFDGVRALERALQVRRGVMSGRIEMADGRPRWTSVYDYFRGMYGTLVALRDARHFAKTGRRATEDAGWADSYLTQTYYSGVGFALGDSNRDVTERARVVRFGATPCREHRTAVGSEDEARAASRWRGRERADYLGDDAKAAISLAPACFNVFTSFLSEDPTVVTVGDQRASEMVEDPTIAWATPNYAVGELTIERAVEGAACDEMDFDVVRNQVGVIPVGGLNRARGFLASSARR